MKTISGNRRVEKIEKRRITQTNVSHGTAVAAGCE